MRNCILVLCISFIAHTLPAQKNSPDPSRRDSGSGKAAPIRPYKDIITDKAVTTKGLFTVHNIEDKWFFEIGDSLLKREFLAVTRFTGTPGGASFYAGEIANQQSMYWEKGPSNKLLLRVAIYVTTATDTAQAIFKAVKNTTLDPIAAAFDIKAFSPGKDGFVIDVTDFFKGDNQVVSLNPDIKRQYNLGSIASDRSFIMQINSFPINTEVSTTKTFTTTSGSGSAFSSNRLIQAGSVSGVITLNMNTSFVLLPTIPMRKRYFDERVGYFADVFTNYDDNSQHSKVYQYIVRWRLEPKEEDLDKFRRGELVEPKKQIIYYIDPATPKKWRKYLLLGINDWQKAFEYAGFKNAIIGKEWPEDDPTMSLEDARFSVIRYFASNILNAYGPNVHDPRSGEIIESHIGWYHNVMTLVHDWYMVQAGAVDSMARKMNFDDELMGQLIRFVSSHEIGHTLGLQHNMGSSSQTPVEKLRDKAWVEANGHTASIMDYARFNYVAQPEDSIGSAGIYPRIGAYDRWAIQWGYRPILDTKNELEDKSVLNKWIIDSLGANPRLWFGEQGAPGDPRSQTEDLGDNAMKASEYGIRNLKRIIVQLPVWAKEEADTYENLQRMYEGITTQFTRYMLHVGKNIGGVYTTRKSVEQNGSVYEPVPKILLKEAIGFYDKQLFTAPAWLYDKSVIDKLGIRPVTHLSGIYNRVLNTILSPSTLLQVVEMANLSVDPYPVEEYLSDCKNSIWKELKTKKPIDIYKRTLQNIYIDKLVNVLNPPSPVLGAGISTIQPEANKSSDIPAIVRAHLGLLKTEISGAILETKDKLTTYHLQNAVFKINEALRSKKAD